MDSRPNPNPIYNLDAVEQPLSIRLDLKEARVVVVFATDSCVDYATRVISAAIGVGFTCTPGPLEPRNNGPRALMWTLTSSEHQHHHCCCSDMRHHCCLQYRL
jgi:hypothetical protein